MDTRNTIAGRKRKPRLQAVLPPHDFARLEALAAREGRSISAMGARLIHEALQARESVS